MTAKEFWARFVSNEAFIRDELSRPDTEETPAANAFALALEEVCLGLGFEMSHNHETGQCKLIITTDSNSEYFIAATHLVDHAPRVPNWTIQALVPPLKKYTNKYLESTIMMDDVHFKIKHLKGAITNYVPDEHLFGITFVLPFIFKNKDQDRLQEALYLLVQEALGERRYASQIQYVEIAYEKSDLFDYFSIDGIDASMQEFGQ